MDCLIFFDLIIYGWGKARYLKSGACIVDGSPLYYDQSLGHPTRVRLVRASQRVRSTCPEEAKSYKKAWIAWKEARKRYLAAKTVEGWEWFTSGHGNKRSIAYRSTVARERRGGIEHYYKRICRYLDTELLPRADELKRAKREMEESGKEMANLRSDIFDKMGVPEYLRSKVLAEGDALNASAS